MSQKLSMFSTATWFSRLDFNLARQLERFLSPVDLVHIYVNILSITFKQINRLIV